jgi:hypothetical protein
MFNIKRSAIKLSLVRWSCVYGGSLCRRNHIHCASLNYFDCEVQTCYKYFPLLPTTIQGYVLTCSCSVPKLNFLLCRTAVLCVDSLFPNTVIEPLHLFVVMATPCSPIEHSVPPGITIRVCKYRIYSLCICMCVCIMSSSA